MKILVVLLAAFCALQLYVRFSRVDVVHWHIDPARAADPGQTGARRTVIVQAAPDEVWARLSTVATAEPRTRLLAGGQTEGRVTYQVRSAFWGFPDYVTIDWAPQGDGTRLTILSRLRFGKGDLGVNAKRVSRWIKAIEQAGQG